MHRHPGGGILTGVTTSAQTPGQDPVPRSEPAAGASPRRRRRLRTADVLLAAMVLASAGALAYVLVERPAGELLLWLLAGELVVCLSYALEFHARWRSSGRSRQFLRRRWFEGFSVASVVVLASYGMGPLAAVVVLTRLARVVDRIAGDGTTLRWVGVLLDPLIDLIRQPITLAVLDEVADVLRAGHYTHNVANALEENRPHLRAMVLEKIKDDPATGRLTGLPFADTVVTTVADTALRVVFEVLADPRTDELFADILRENLDQIQASVREHGIDAAIRPVGLDDGVPHPRRRP